MHIESIEVDDQNLHHATRHGVSLTEIMDAFDNANEVRQNRSGRSADYFVISRTRTGRTVRVNFVHDSVRHTARPISAWEVPPCRRTRNA